MHRTLSLGVALAASGSIAHAEPSWADAATLVTAATANIDSSLRACTKKPPPFRVGFYATRTRQGSTSVSMPIYSAGIRGISVEDRCLATAVAQLVLPQLPEGIDRIGLLHIVPADGAPTPDDFSGWNDVPATLATIFTAEHRTAIAGCSKRSRTARFNLDVRAGTTTVWLPAWQFHSAAGDGSTPAAEQTVKRCMTREVVGWIGPRLPAAMGELQASFVTR